MIDILDIKDVTVEEIVDMLLDENSESLEISVPKSTQLYFSDPEAILQEYALLAYTGQVIKAISTDFHYEEIEPELHESVVFTVKGFDIQKLADGLLQISYGFENKHEDEEFIFHEEVETFLGDVEDKKVEAACPYFIEVYLKLQKQIDSEQSNC